MVDEGADARFAALFRAHYIEVQRFLERRVADREDAAELAADVFRVAWQRFDPGAPLGRAWLFAVARNVLGDHYRRVQRRRDSEQGIRDAAALDAQPTASVAPDDDHPVRRALDTLAPEVQDLLRLRYWEQLDIAEIAEVLGLSPATTRVRLHRARARLRAALPPRTAQKGNER